MPYRITSDTKSETFAVVRYREWDPEAATVAFQSADESEARQLAERLNFIERRIAEAFDRPFMELCEALHREPVAVLGFVENWLNDKRSWLTAAAASNDSEGGELN